MRLEYSCYANAFNYYENFNSIKVRLESFGSILTTSVFVLFQFHKGAIGVRLKNGLGDANKAVFVS